MTNELQLTDPMAQTSLKVSFGNFDKCLSCHNQIPIKIIKVQSIQVSTAINWLQAEPVVSQCDLFYTRKRCRLLINGVMMTVECKCQYKHSKDGSYKGQLTLISDFLERKSEIILTRSSPEQ